MDIVEEFPSGPPLKEGSEVGSVTGSGPDPGQEAWSQMESLAREREKLTAERDELQDMLVRRQADYENLRRRVERERAESREYASMEAVQALLPVLDDFERSIRSVPAGDAMRDYVKGMELIHQRLLDSLTKLGLQPVESVGRRFDPNVHNAIQKEERPDVDEDTVVEEYQRGYHFKSRLLRPAMVKVAVRS